MEGAEPERGDPEAQAGWTVSGKPRHRRRASPTVTPPPPGWTLEADIAEEYLAHATPTISQAEAARRLGWSTNRMNEFVKGKRGVTAENALALADLTGASPEFWMNLQTSYDLWRAHKRLGAAQTRGGQLQRPGVGIALKLTLRSGIVPVPDETNSVRSITPSSPSCT